MPLRHRYHAQGLREPKAAEELHRADIGDVHLRMLRGIRIPFDHHRLHAEAGQRQRQGHADRASARNQDGDETHFIRAF